MKLSHTIGAAILISCGSVLYAGEVVDLQPGDFTNGLSGIMNTQMSELIGVTVFDDTQTFSILGTPQGFGKGVPELLYEGTLKTRVVRSNLTGNLTFNYRVLNPNPDLFGMISHIEISGFAGFQTRVEYRNEFTAPGQEGPISAGRSEDGDILNFDFGELLDTGEESKFFFAMLDTGTFNSGSAFEGMQGAQATIYLLSGESVVINLPAGPVVPTPGAFGLLGLAGLITVRRRR